MINRFLITISMLILLVSCTTSPSLKKLREESALISSPGNLSGGWAMQARYGKRALTMNIKYLKIFSEEMQSIINEFSAFRKNMSGKDINSYTAEQHDRIESIFYRFIVCWESLWDIVEYYSEHQGKAPDSKSGVKGFLIGYDAAIHISFAGSKLVNSFIDEPSIAAKLNEGFPACDVPSGTFDKLANTLTSLEYIESMETAWKIFDEEMSDASSKLATISRSDTECAELAADIKKMRYYQEAQIDRLLKNRAIIFPTLENKIRHSKVITMTNEARKKIKEEAFGAASIAATMILRIVKSPVVNHLKLSDEEISEIKKTLKPGDCILTFSKGYLTNIFIPGKFKHGLTYIGTSAQRAVINPTGKMPTARQLEKRASLMASFDCLPGFEPDLIEAVGEGVVFNSVENILRNKINRMVVLRPQVDPEIISAHLSTVMSFIGLPYDLKFDFLEATYLCCTEVIYKSLNKKGRINFQLVPRMGRMTLSADDIIKYQLKSPVDAKPFAVIAVIEEDKEKGDGEPLITVGAEAENRLAAIMQ